MTSAQIQKGYLLWVMLNPSTADAEVDDATIRRCKSFTTRFGFREMVVVNLYAYRATDPAELLTVEDPVGAENDAWLYEAARRASRVVLGWGGSADPARARAVAEILTVDNPVLYCLGTNKDGSPRHPLYLGRNTPLEFWEVPK
jgi:hypothetical protein